MVVAAVGVAAGAYGALRAADRGASVSAIVDEWGPSVPLVTCTYLNPDGTMRSAMASGTFVREGTHEYVLASVHAVGSDSATPVSCVVTFPGGSQLTVMPTDISVDPNTFDVEKLSLPEASSSASAP